MTVKVFSKPNCVQCTATERRLLKLEIPFVKVDVTLDMEALDHITRLGYQQVPVVEYKGEHWSGYRPQLIEGLANARKDAA